MFSVFSSSMLSNSLTRLVCFPWYVISGCQSALALQLNHLPLTSSGLAPSSSYAIWPTQGGGTSASLGVSTSFSTMCTVLPPVILDCASLLFHGSLVDFSTRCFHLCCELSTTIFAEQLYWICYVLTIVIPSIQSLGDVAGNHFVWEWVFPVTIPACEAPILTLISVSASGVEISVSIHSVTKMWGCVCLGFSGPWGAWGIGYKLWFKLVPTSGGTCLEHACNIDVVCTLGENPNIMSMQGHK